MQQSELKEKQRLDAQRRRDQQRQMLQDMREKRLQEIEQAKEARRVEVAKRSPTASLLPLEEHAFRMSLNTHLQAMIGACCRSRASVNWSAASRSCRCVLVFVLLYQ